MLFVIREEVRKALQDDRISVTRLGLEQPADPTHYVPELVTFWKTEEVATAQSSVWSSRPKLQAVSLGRGSGEAHDFCR